MGVGLPRREPLRLPELGLRVRGQQGQRAMHRQKRQGISDDTAISTSRLLALASLLVSQLFQLLLPLQQRLVVRGRPPDGLSGIVNEDVDVLVLFQHAVDHALDGGQAAEVRGEDREAAVERRKIVLPLEVLQCVARESGGHHNSSSSAKQLQRTGSSDFDTTSGHHCDHATAIGRLISLLLVEPTALLAQGPRLLGFDRQLAHVALPAGSLLPLLPVRSRLWSETDI
mmetsp:Transcript_36399/g.104670  ORF Transcript_36399/g.104670 Transcript_36399/m.104670 type:complete len:228 (-) Transcript_36399:1918-2601(-)